MQRPEMILKRVVPLVAATTGITKSVLPDHAVDVHRPANLRVW